MLLNITLFVFCRQTSKIESGQSVQVQPARLETYRYLVLKIRFNMVLFIVLSKKAYMLSIKYNLFHFHHRMWQGSQGFQKGNSLFTTAMSYYPRTVAIEYYVRQIIC